MPLFLIIDDIKIQMRLKRHKTIKYDAELNLPAMVDVILLLLIFFMCTHSFNEPEKSIESEIVRTGKAKIETTELIEPIIISLKKKNEGIELLCDGNNCNSFNDLQTTLVKYRTFSDTNIMIKSLDDVPFEYMVETLDRCKLAGFENIGFSTSELR